MTRQDRVGFAFGVGMLLGGLGAAVGFVLAWIYGLALW